VLAGALFEQVGVPAPYVAGAVLALAALGILVRVDDSALGLTSASEEGGWRFPVARHRR
jgi:hypothetical protein